MLSIMMNSFGNVFWGPGPFWGFGFFGALAGALMLVLVVAIIALKGYALWYAAKRDEKWWFVIMLVINTAGLLELAYLLFVVKKWHRKATHTGAHHETHEHHNG